MALFAVSRWPGAFSGAIDGDPVPAVATDASMMWSIVLLDLGTVVPLSVATTIGLAVRWPWATKALYGVVGWLALVPPSATAMALVKIARDDHNANPCDTRSSWLSPPSSSSPSRWPCSRRSSGSGQRAAGGRAA